MVFCILGLCFNFNNKGNFHKMIIKNKLYQCIQVSCDAEGCKETRISSDGNFREALKEFKGFGWQNAPSENDYGKWFNFCPKHKRIKKKIKCTISLFIPIKKGNIKKDITKEALIEFKQFIKGESLTNSKIENDEDYLNYFYLKSIENEYFRKLYDTLSYKSNIESLITPLDPDKKDPLSLFQLAKRMRDIKKVSKTVSLTSLLLPHTLSEIRTKLMMSKQWVGIGALGITGHAIAQRWNMYLETKFKPTLINAKDGIISLGKKLNEDGKKISVELSYFISAFVDAEKNDYITDLVYDKRIVGLVISMVRMGISTKTIFDFVNQPIIMDFVNFAKLGGFTKLSNTN